MGAEAHHPFGPSSLKRRELCPGSFRMEKDLPSVDTEESKSGTNLHEIIAKILSGDDTLVVPMEDAELVRMMEDKFYEIRGTEPKDFFIEKQLSFSYCGIEQLSGTADVVIVLNDRIIIIDWKTGHRPVEEASDNVQGAAYALAAMQEFKKEIAEVHFYNPRIKQDSFHTFTNRNALASYIMRVISSCMKGNAPIIPGEEQCRYCKAAAHGTCPMLAKTAEITATRAEELIPLKSLSALTVDELCELKRRCDLVAKLGERVDNRIKAVCEESGSCGRWRLKEVSGGKEIKDINAVFSAVSGVLDAPKFLEACSVSVSKLKGAYATVLKESGAFQTKKEGEAQFMSTLSELIFEKPPKKQLVEGK